MTFHATDLGSETTLLLTFDRQPISGYFPVAWRVDTFEASGAYALTVTYDGQLAFIKPQVVGDVILGSTTWIDINLGQSTKLREDKPGVFSFSVPEPIPEPNVKASNRTPFPQGIGLGTAASFSNSETRTYKITGLETGTGNDLPPMTVLYFEDVPVDNAIVAQFLPILRAYITDDYKQGQIIHNPIHFPLIWEQDLSTLPANTSYTLSRDPATGSYTITQDVEVVDRTH